MSKNLEPVVYSTIRRLCDDRVAAKRVPAIATEREVKEVVSKLVEETLTDMVTDGLLQVSHNINGIRMFAPINAEKIDDDDIKYRKILHV